MAVGSNPAACSHGRTGMESQNKATQARYLMRKTCSVLAEWNPEPALRDGRPTSAGSGGGERWALAVRCLLGITHRAFSSLCFQKQLLIWLVGLGLPRDTHFSRPKYLVFPFTSAVFGAFAWPLEMWARSVIQLPHEQAGASAAGAAYGNHICRFLG